MSEDRALAADRRIEIQRPDGTAVTVELKAGQITIGEWNRPGEEGTRSGHTLSRDWPGTRTDFTLAEELLRVVHERDRLKALAARQHALLLAEETLYTETDPGPHCPTCWGVHDGDQQLHTDDCEREALLILSADLLAKEKSE